MGNLQKSTIINGSSTLAVAQQDGVVRSLQPVEAMTEIVFNNLAANTTKKFKLSNSLVTNYRAMSFVFDVVSDDAESLPSSTTDPQRPFLNIYFKTFRNGKSIFTLNQQLVVGESYLNNYYLLEQDELEIRSSVALNSITFRCVPVIVEPTIVFP